MSERAHRARFGPQTQPSPGTRTERVTTPPPFDMNRFVRASEGRQEIPDSAVQRTAARDSEIRPIVEPTFIPLSSVPRCCVSVSELYTFALDSQCGYLLSLIDGQTSVEALLDVSPLSKEETLRLLGRLAGLGVLVFH